MLDPSMYPAAPATMHPTARPTMMLMFLRNGEPKSSVRRILTNERKPRPMNSGEPQGSGRGARVVGQSWNMPLVGKFWHPFDPPPQSSAPELPTREAPMSRMAVPGGYVRRRSTILYRSERTGYNWREDPLENARR